MVERDDGFDTLRQEPVDEVAVEHDSLLVDRILTPSWGDNARPGDGEAVYVRAESRHQLDILFPSIVVVACDIRILVIRLRGLQVAEGVPYRLSFAVLMDAAFDLQCCRGSSPLKSAGSLSSSTGRLWPVDLLNVLSTSVARNMDASVAIIITSWTSKWYGGEASNTEVTM